MIERAKWRVGERQTPARLLFGVDRWHGVPVSVLIAGSAAGYALLSAFAEAWLGKEWDSLITSPLSWVAFAAVGLGLRRPKGALAPDPAPLPVFPVDVVFRHSERVVGRDSGVVSFVDGWLVYEGERTSFSLSASDAKAFFFDRSTTLGLAQAQALEFRPTANVGELKDALKRWTAGTPATGLSRLPPLEPHPSAQAKTAFALQTFGSLVLGMTLGTTLGGLLLGRGLTTHMVPTLAFCALVAASFSCLGQALVASTRPRRFLAGSKTNTDSCQPSLYSRITTILGLKT